MPESNFEPKGSTFGKVAKIILIAVVAIFVLIVVFGSFYTIQEEEQAVVCNFGVPAPVTSSGLHFYTFILDRYTTYRQVQQTMGYGCNLKAAL